MTTESTCHDALMHNYGVFERELPTLLDQHRGEYALVGNEEISVFPNAQEALAAGGGKFQPGEFVVQEIVPQIPAISTFELGVC